MIKSRQNMVQCDKITRINPHRRNWGLKTQQYRGAIFRIRYLPTGARLFDPARPGNETKVDLHFPEPRCKFFLPAAFRSGTCVVTVKNPFRGGRQRSDGPSGDADRASASTPGTRPPTPGSDFLYFTVWPTARRLAGYNLERCHGREGPVRVDSCPENKK